MRCFRCLVEYQNNDRGREEGINKAEFVYAGESLCREHVNTVRGHHARFDRYARKAATP